MNYDTVKYILHITKYKQIINKFLNKFLFNTHARARANVGICLCVRVERCATSKFFFE